MEWILIEGIPSHKHLIWILKVSLESLRNSGEAHHQDLEVLSKISSCLNLQTSAVKYSKIKDFNIFNLSTPSSEIQSLHLENFNLTLQLFSINI